MKGEQVSTPVDPGTRMEVALGPDNTHTVKALPPTSWHLTIIFKPKQKHTYRD